MEAKTNVSKAAVFDNISITDSVEGVYTLIAECTDCPNGPLFATSTPVRVVPKSEVWVVTDCGVIAPPSSADGLEGVLEHSCVLSVSLVEGGGSASLIAPVIIEIDVLDKVRKPAVMPRIRVVPDEHVFIPGEHLTKTIRIEAVEQKTTTAEGTAVPDTAGSFPDRYTVVVRTRSDDHRWTEPAVRWPNGNVAHIMAAPAGRSTLILPSKLGSMKSAVSERAQPIHSRSDFRLARPGKQLDATKDVPGQPAEAESIKQTSQERMPLRRLPSLFLSTNEDNVAQIKWNSTDILVREGSSIDLSFQLGSRPLDSVYVSISCPSPFIKHVKDRAEVQPEDWLFGDSLILNSLPRPGYQEAQYSVSCQVSSRSKDPRWIFDSDSFSRDDEDARIFGTTVHLSIYRHQCHDGSFRGICPCPAGYVCDGATVLYKCPAGTERWLAARDSMPVTRRSNPTALMVKGIAHMAGEAICNRPSHFRAGCTIVRQASPSGWYESGYQSSTSAEVRKFRLQMQGYCGMGTYGRLYVDVIGRPGEYYATYNSTCATCPPGTFCYDVGIVNFQAYKCPAGHYCLGSDSIPVPCPPGERKYNPFRGAMSSNACMTCPDGFDCETLRQKIEPELCPPGFICPFGRKKIACPAGTVNPLPGQSALEQCERCPAGYYCPNKAGKPKPCPSGTYNPFEGASSSTECVPCPLGFQCDTPGAVYYTNRCSAGGYCNAAGASPTLCPEGTWKPGYFGNSLMHCHVCPPGAQCKQGTTAATVEKCPRGSFCSSGTYLKVETGNGLRKQEICAPCEPGNSCKDGFPVPCGKGYYSGPGQNDCDECPEGFYCPLEKTTKYLLRVYRCPDSHHCPKTGTGKSRQHCLVNENVAFRAFPACARCVCTGLLPLNVRLRQTMESPSRRLSLLRSRFGARRHLMEPLSSSVPAALSDPVPRKPVPCPKGHFCTRASANAVPCPPGTYNALRGQKDSSACLPVRAGHFCDLGACDSKEGNGQCSKVQSCEGHVSRRA
uniref:PAN domain-containing protein n=1 Tax=Toxoplasma gondii (strain ATCC 50861 / VEG) TaxID=432359 RepID=A0A0F7V2X5_TOXGV|nr:TPA: PAN domain-containing protein [Toxoplasma gondii VEG]